jgi:hypothetical protein
MAKTVKTDGVEKIKVEKIKVEKGVPVPPLRQGIGLDAALASMEVGDSFRIGRGHYGSVRSMASLRRYSIKTRDDGDGYIRVWRIA